MKQEIITAIAAAGFEVWMRDPSDSYLLFTNGKNIGYLQKGDLDGLSISTVHMPNATSGTGYRVVDHVEKIDAPTLARAFITAPDWGRGANTVKKYRDMEHYRSRDSFNAAYKQISVPRYVVTYVNKDGMRTLIGASQGRNTFATEPEAKTNLEAVTTNNGPKTIQQVWGENPRFEVRCCPCYPGHFDPQNVWFD